MIVIVIREPWNPELTHLFTSSSLGRSVSIPLRGGNHATGVVRRAEYLNNGNLLLEVVEEA